MRTRYAIPIIMTLCLLGAQTPQSAAKKVTLKLSESPPITGNPYISAGVNGFAGLFLLDTGMVSMDSTISPAFAKRCGLANSMGTLAIDDGKGNSMKLDDHFFASVNVGGADGVLGRAFFENIRMTIDYPAHEVVFERYDEESKKDKNAVALTFRFLKARNAGWEYKGPYVDAKVDDKPIILVLDTGANWSTINANVVDTLGLKTRKEKVHGANYDVAHVKFTCGDLAIEDAPFAKLTNPQLTDTASATGEKIAGIVGNNILGKYRVTFDYRKKTAFFHDPAKK